MKRSFPVLLSVLVLASACGHSEKEAENTPKEVETAFNQKFPDAQKVKWEKENANEWEAEFELNGKEYSANFLKDGTWKETEYEISLAEVPEDVMHTIDTQFPDHEVQETELSERALGNVYAFELENADEKVEVEITADGSSMKKTYKSEENEDSEE
ncbi:MAG: hypothetical protein GC178_01685 [Flavobacteriales bacterium]|nr:hypothetical protein [Flavobacteriales bacterium]